ncbi:hypothetical protein [Nafulsella turpanensis]|uniref:hypothetical protein n=1 Tax=Nafulsella turpanensis TaxID=1265690 RepID=UPI000347FB10|nr:hypothetical protein [Nafulsella turpanensis]
MRREKLKQIGGAYHAIGAYGNQKFAEALLHYLEQTYYVSGKALIGGMIILDDYLLKDLDFFLQFQGVRVEKEIDEILVIPYSAVNQMLIKLDLN